MYSRCGLNSSGECRLYKFINGLHSGLGAQKCTNSASIETITPVPPRQSLHSTSTSGYILQTAVGHSASSPVAPVVTTIRPISLVSFPCQTPLLSSRTSLCELFTDGIGRKRSRSIFCRLATFCGLVVSFRRLRRTRAT